MDVQQGDDARVVQAPFDDVHGDLTPFAAGTAQQIVVTRQQSATGGRMTAHAGSIPAEAAFRRARWPAERLFYTGFTLALIAAVVLGFSRTFFFRHWYPDWARAHGPPETFFYIHGAL